MLKDRTTIEALAILLTICLARTNHHGRFEALPNPHSAVHQWAVRGPCQVSLIFAFPFLFFLLCTLLPTVLTTGVALFRP